MNYKKAFKPIKSAYRHLPDGKQKVPFDESKFSKDFVNIKNCCIFILEYYHNGNGEILPLIEQLNLFFSDNIMELFNIDISPIQNLYAETEFDKFIFEIFSSDNISLEILDNFITHFSLILEFCEFQSIFKLYDNFQCFYSLFINYKGEDNEALVYSLLKYYTCQYQYENTYIALFEDFNSLSNKIFDIMGEPFYNYQLSDFIVSAISSKKSSSDIDKDIISGVISNYNEIIDNLPTFDADDNECLIVFYHICKKMVKTDCLNTLKILKENKMLKTLFSTPNKDSIPLKKSRIDFLRICLSNLQTKTDKIYILNKSKKNFDFSMIIQCAQSDSSILIKASLKFLSSFIPDLIDELYRNYTPETIIDFIKDILSKGQFAEKYESIEFITSLIKNKNYPFIRQLLLVDDDEENIFQSFDNLMQADDNKLKIKILSMIDALFEYFGIESHQRDRDIFIELIQNSGLGDDFEQNIDSENEKVSEYSKKNWKSMDYYSNLKQNPNF